MDVHLSTKKAPGGTLFCGLPPMPLGIFGPDGKFPAVVNGGFGLSPEATVVEIDEPLGRAVMVFALMRSRHLRAHGNLRSCGSLNVHHAIDRAAVALEAPAVLGRQGFERPPYPLHGPGAQPGRGYVGPLREDDQQGRSVGQEALSFGREFARHRAYSGWKSRFMVSEPSVP